MLLFISLVVVFMKISYHTPNNTFLQFGALAQVDVVPCDISVAGRVLAAFPEKLKVSHGTTVLVNTVFSITHILMVWMDCSLSNASQTTSPISESYAKSQMRLLLSCPTYRRPSLNSTLALPSFARKDTTFHCTPTNPKTRTRKQSRLVMPPSLVALSTQSFAKVTLIAVSPLQ